MLCSKLLVRQQTLELCYVGSVSEAFLAQVALQLRGLAVAVEQVTLANMAALELTVLGNGKSLFCTAVRFDLRHKVLLLSEFALYLRVGFTCPLRVFLSDIVQTNLVSNQYQQAKRQAKKPVFMRVSEGSEIIPTRPLQKYLKHV